MKNAFKTFGIIAILAVMAFSMTSCEMDPGDDGVKKSLQITEIPSTGTNAVTGQLTVTICDKPKQQKWEIYALGQATPRNNSVTVPLISATTKEQFTGTGDFYIVIFEGYNSDTGSYTSAYVYTGGGDLAVKYEIKKGVETSTVSWDKFKKE